MAAGDVLLITGEVVHGGGADTTSGQWRRGLALSYVVGWMRTEEAHNLAIFVDRARQLPPRLRELLSLAGYRAPMGMVYQLDMADPYVTLFDEPRPEPLPSKALGAHGSLPPGHGLGPLERNRAL